MSGIPTIHTVNVVEVDNDGIVTIRAFCTSKEGIQAAEGLFRQILSETTDLEARPIEVALEEGYADVPGGGSVQLCWSSP